MKEEYDKLLKSGMFFEIFPELTGNYEKDKEQWSKMCETMKWFLEDVCKIKTENK